MRPLRQTRTHALLIILKKTHVIIRSFSVLYINQIIMVKKAVSSIGRATTANSYKFLQTMFKTAYPRCKKEHMSMIEGTQGYVGYLYDAYRRRTGQLRSTRGRAPLQVSISYVGNKGVSRSERVKESSRRMFVSRAVLPAVMADMLKNSGLSDEKLDELLSSALDRVADCASEDGIDAVEVEQDGSSGGALERASGGDNELEEDDNVSFAI